MVKRKTGKSQSKRVVGAKPNGTHRIKTTCVALIGGKVVNEKPQELVSRGPQRGREWDAMYLSDRRPCKGQRQKVGQGYNNGMGETVRLLGLECNGVRGL